MIEQSRMEMIRRGLGRTGLAVGPLGFGAFKIGRNQGIKYPTAYDLPDDVAVARLLNTVLDLGINLIDTAPAYGLSEERIGRTIGHRRSEYVLSTKVGEEFSDGRSSYDFSRAGITASVHRSLRRMRTEAIDLVFLHSPGDDVELLEQTDAVATLSELKSAGLIRAIGLSGKTVEGARLALRWADVLMVEYHVQNRSHDEVLHEATARGVGIVVKKGLASGTLDAADAIPFVLQNPAITSLIVGGLNIDHIRANLQIAVSTVRRPHSQAEAA